MEFSPKQRRVLTWWRPGSPDRDKQAIICDGAVRSGKTLCTGLSFFCWAMQSFQNRRFALCGRTIVSVRRNLLEELLPLLETHRVSWNWVKGHADNAKNNRCDELAVAQSRAHARA